MTRRVTYSVSTRDPGQSPLDDWAWRVRYRRLPKWSIRQALRELRGRGYENDISILVERESAARKRRIEHE
jgi:hypothetical protein